MSLQVESFVAGLGHYPQLLPVPFVMSAVLAAGAYLWMGEPDRTRPKEGFLKMGVQGLRTLFVHAELRAYVLNAVTISAVTFFAFWFYQPVARRAGMSVAYLGLLGAGFNLFSTLLLANSALLERALGIRRVLLVSAIVPAVLFAALGFVHRLAFVVPAFFVLVGCKMVRMPVLNDLINRHIESENRATVISSMSLLERLVIFLLYPLVGGLADVSVNYALYTLAALCAAFAVGTRLTDQHLPAGVAPAARERRVTRT